MPTFPSLSLPMLRPLRKALLATLLVPLLVTLLAALLSILPWAGAQAQTETPNSAVILQYHHVAGDTPPSTSLPPEAFAAHLHHLRQEGFAVLALEDLLARLQRGEDLPERSAAITFDDGYVSVYEQAFPLLRELAWPFTVFVNPARVGSSPGLYADWEQLREMAAAGATLANHTLSHPSLLGREAAESEADWLGRVRFEIESAEARILGETGQSHRLLAYPYGEFGPRITRLVDELGYVGIGQHSGPVSAGSDFLALPRFPFSGVFASMNSFPLKVASLAFSLEGQEPASPLTDSPNPAVTLRFAPGPYDLGRMSCFHNDQPMRVEHVGERELRISGETQSRTRRFRYNCTAPGPDGRWYWLSIPWVNPSIPE